MLKITKMKSHIVVHKAFMICDYETELSYTLRMMKVKTTFNVPQLTMDQIFEYNIYMMGPYNRLPCRYYDSEKLISKLGLGLAHEKIDCCVNNCMLYYKSNISDIHCKFCGEPQFKPHPHGYTSEKEVPHKRMHYSPLIPLGCSGYMHRTVLHLDHMPWHHEDLRQLGIMCHSSDSEAWKHFDTQYPDFAAEPQNVRLGLCVALTGFLHLV